VTVAGAMRMDWVSVVMVRPLRPPPSQTHNNFVTNGVSIPFIAQ
jgi:hypothetical protein